MLAWSSQDDRGLTDPALSPQLNSPISPHPHFEPSSALTYSRKSADYVGTGRLGEPLPKKRNDALAEAWGVAEPEPFEEFFAGDGSGRASTASSVRASADGSHPRRGRELKAEVSSEKPRLAPRRTTQRAPPPKPIAVPGGTGFYTESDIPSSNEPDSPGTKRSRSLMQRIRKMRENPNIPVSSEANFREETIFPVTSDSARMPRPSHKSHNSFLGRFTKPPNPFVSDEPPASPFSDNAAVDNVAKEKQLPMLPASVPTSAGSVGDEGYFDGVIANGETSGSNGLSRRTSLMRKVVNGVKRNVKT